MNEEKWVSSGEHPKPSSFIYQLSKNNYRNTIVTIAGERNEIFIDKAPSYHTYIYPPKLKEKRAERMALCKSRNAVCLSTLIINYLRNYYARQFDDFLEFTRCQTKIKILYSTISCRLQI